MSQHTWIAVLLPSLAGAVSEAGLSFLLYRPFERKWNGAEVRTNNRTEFLRYLNALRARAGALENALRDEHARKRPHSGAELSAMIREIQEAVDGVKYARHAFQEDLKFFRKSYYDLVFVQWGYLYRRWLSLGAPPYRGNVTAGEMAALLLPPLRAFQEEADLAVRKVEESLQKTRDAL